MVFVSAIGGFLFGYDTGVISGAMIPIKRQFHLSYESQEIIVAITLVGAIIGAVSSAYLNDRFGRRIVLLTAAFSFTVGSITMGLAVKDVSLIIVGRFIVGLGIGKILIWFGMSEFICRVTMKLLIIWLLVMMFLWDSFIYIYDLLLQYKRRLYKHVFCTNVIGK